MEPRIRYAQTKDGVSIALWALGEGMPFVYMCPGPFSHIELEWQLPEARPEYEWLARERQLVRYDERGKGLSDRNISGAPLERDLLDLEAVVDHLDLDKFALYAPFYAGPTAIAYSVRHPERVSHLMLWCSWAREPEPEEWPALELQKLNELITSNWDMYTETFAHAFIGWEQGEPARRFAALMRASITPETLLLLMADSPKTDVTALLPQVRCPTLVLQRREVPFPPMEAARGLATRIPDARLALLEGRSMACYLGDMEAAMAAIDEFLGEPEHPSARPQPATAVHTILFTDMESSTALTQRLGDAKAQELLRTHNAIVRDALKTHAGREIKHTGDGIMASFLSASGALECAVAIQQAFQRQAEPPLRVRIGLNAGEPVAEEQDLFGTAVQLARRICDHAEPDQILAPIVVRELAAGKGFLFADIGESELRGFEDPVRLYEVRWREDS